MVSATSTSTSLASAEDTVRSNTKHPPRNGGEDAAQASGVDPRVAPSGSGCVECLASNGW
jgi:hypothetical protein